MLTKFWEGLGGKLGESWVATIFTPAFVFWFGGFWVAIAHFGWQPVETWFSQQSQTLQGAILISSLLGVFVSGVLVHRLDLVVLRFLEGYYYPIPIKRFMARWLIYGFKRPGKRLRALRRRKSKLRSQKQDLTGYQKNRYLELQSEWDNLPFQQMNELQDQFMELDDRDSQEYVKKMLLLRHTPYRESQRMPTRLGNILRNAELRPSSMYGLDTVVCWPYLWLLLPEDVRKELITVRTDLQTGARIWLWSVLFIGWVVWAKWAAILGLLSALLAYRWMLSVAENYSCFLDAAFALHRKKLYETMGWKMPSTSEEEREFGQQLTQLFQYGSDPNDSVFSTTGTAIQSVTLGKPTH